MNRKLVIILVWMTAAMTSLPARAQEKLADVRYMSLEECLDYAYKHNEDIIIANLEIEKSQAKVGEYLSQGLPQIDAKASVNKNFILRRTFLPADQFNPAAPADSVIELKFGLPYDGDIGLNIIRSKTGKYYKDQIDDYLICIIYALAIFAPRLLLDFAQLRVLSVSRLPTLRNHSLQCLLVTLKLLDLLLQQAHLRFVRLFRITNGVNNVG